MDAAYVTDADQDLDCSKKGGYCMKKWMMATVVSCMVLTGCGMGTSVSEAGMETESSMELGSIEDIAAVEVTKNLATTEQLGIKELTNNWPENVYYDANGVYADPLSTTIEITEPVTLTISGVTMDGSLRLKILNQDTYEVFLDEKNPEGEYTVSLNQSGMYTILFYAKEHVGSVDIAPEEI